MNIFGSLLFLHGHVASAELARQLASPAAAPATCIPDSAGRQPATSECRGHKAAGQRPALP
ncbi:hypothetical protein I5U42_08540 [Stenotrophomonas maltophilia]|uniref:hypothetical protein n=1 Tax=Stenotrophomonas sp. RAC2 TaxID=3064902 RepID=UPI0013100018|nr:hypothetical protein [Stenotrophomonas sp. RAC2]MBH1431347.1 hypothetical protein [Stenotrophomonas maltophilia]MDV9043640.1 hypothetical protein [Stenotrophomonas sp. RAC2]